MGEIYQRWVELATDVLDQPPGIDPIPLIGVTLADDFRAGATGLVQVLGQRATVRPLGPQCRRPLDLAVYAQLVPYAPVIQHSLTGPVDTRVRSSQDADEKGNRRWRQLRAQLDHDGVGQYLIFPMLPSSATRRWLVLARAEPFTVTELDLAHRVHRLVTGLQRYAMVAPLAPSGAARSTPVVRAGDAPASPLLEVAPTLTRRELAVLILMAEGLITHAIGHRLGVSPRTVAKHQERIYRKLNTTDRLTTVLKAQAVGILAASSASLAPAETRPPATHRTTRPSSARGRRVTSVLDRHGSEDCDWVDGRTPAVLDATGSNTKPGGALVAARR